MAEWQSGQWTRPGAPCVLIRGERPNSPTTTTKVLSSKPRLEKGTIASHWTDASHTQWFDSLFDQFKAAMQSGDFVSRELREAVACVQIIETCYRSSAEGSRELALPLDVLEI